MPSIDSGTPVGSSASIRASGSPDTPAGAATGPQMHGPGALPSWSTGDALSTQPPAQEPSPQSNRPTVSVKPGALAIVSAALIAGGAACAAPGVVLGFAISASPIGIGILGALSLLIVGKAALNKLIASK